MKPKKKPVKKMRMGGPGGSVKRMRAGGASGVKKRKKK
tara:strand:+ start:666 stop:779 length:114 start_codon:yes stop_codon:yes gene_type:complete